MATPQQTEAASAASSSAASAAESHLPVDITPIAEVLVLGIEILSIAILVLGALWATFVFLRGLHGEQGGQQAYEDYRRNLGRSILLGLEFLVVADIINTIGVRPSFRSLGILGLLVVIRTFLSYALEVEIKGRWPWKDAEAKARQQDQSQSQGQGQSQSQGSPA